MPSSNPNFPETSWTLVLAAGAHGANALSHLCSAYWPPVYAYIRRRGYSPEAAQDLTQEFFLQILARPFFARADPNQGRFRSFLMGSVKFLLADQADFRNALKRGGGHTQLPFPLAGAETHYAPEPSHNDTPDRLFERQWAWTVIHRVTAHLQDELTRQGRADQFDLFRGFLIGQSEVAYPELAARSGISEGALRTGASRFRKRFAELLRAEVASTVASPADIDAELRFLIAALQGKAPE